MSSVEVARIIARLTVLRDTLCEFRLGRAGYYSEITVGEVPPPRCDDPPLRVVAKFFFCSSASQGVAYGAKVVADQLVEAVALWATDRDRGWRAWRPSSR